MDDRDLPSQVWDALEGFFFAGEIQQVKIAKSIRSEIQTWYVFLKCLRVILKIVYLDAWLTVPLFFQKVHFLRVWTIFVGIKHCCCMQPFNMTFTTST